MNHTARLPQEKPYRCEVCGQFFKYLKSFHKHRANHTVSARGGKMFGGKWALGRSYGTLAGATILVCFFFDICGSLPVLDLDMVELIIGKC